LQNEKLTAEIENFSTSAVSKGVPPYIAKLLSPYAVKSKTEAFSEKYSEFGKVAEQIMEFFSSDEAFKSKLPTNVGDDYIRGVETESFSAEAIIASVKKECEAKGIEIGSEKYSRMLAARAAKGE